jgi:hypothetical protein
MQRRGGDIRELIVSIGTSHEFADRKVSTLASPFAVSHGLNVPLPLPEWAAPDGSAMRWQLS